MANTSDLCSHIRGRRKTHIRRDIKKEYGRFKTFANIDKLIFFLAVGFIKVSICFFNQRLTSLTSQAWRIFNNIFLFLLFVYINLALFWNIFQCNPPYAGWDAIRTAKRGRPFHCTSDTIISSALSITCYHGLRFAVSSTNYSVESQNGSIDKVTIILRIQHLPL